MSKLSQQIIDCLIIGAGPAGISAALYLHRFRRVIRLVDTGESRALLIPKSHNYPGFIKGVSGPVLLKRLKGQLATYDIPIHLEEIKHIKITPENTFLSNQYIHSKTVILATGVIDTEPNLPQVNQAIKRGLVRLCPVCDAYEVMNKNIAIIGYGSGALKEALFLKRYSPFITLITQGCKKSFTKHELHQIQEARINTIENPILKVERTGSQITALRFGENEVCSFDTIYVALGCHKRIELAKQIGVKLCQGELIVDKFQETSVPGFYGAGDIVSGLNQICVAQAQGAIAASAINHYLQH